MLYLRIYGVIITQSGHTRVCQSATGRDIVKRILSHEITTINKRKVLNLTIKWHGYKEPEITGMNMSLQRNGAVQEYLKEKGLQSFGLKTKRSDDNAKDSNDQPKSKCVRFSSNVPDNN